MAELNRRAMVVQPIRRMDGADMFLIDAGNYILDCSFGHIANQTALDHGRRVIPGVMEPGLFLEFAELKPAWHRRKCP